MDLDPKNVADRTVARRILAVSDRLSDQEKLILSRELKTKNPNVKVIQDIVNSK